MLIRFHSNDRQNLRIHGRIEAKETVLISKTLAALPMFWSVALASSLFHCGGMILAAFLVVSGLPFMLRKYSG